MAKGLDPHLASFERNGVWYDFYTNAHKSSLEYHLLVTIRKVTSNGIRMVFNPKAVNSLGEPLPGIHSGVFVAREDYRRVQRIFDIYSDAQLRALREADVMIDWYS